MVQVLDYSILVFSRIRNRGTASAGTGGWSALTRDTVFPWMWSWRKQSRRSFCITERRRPSLTVSGKKAWSPWAVCMCTYPGMGRVPGKSGSGMAVRWYCVFEAAIWAGQDTGFIYRPMAYGSQKAYRRSILRCGNEFLWPAALTESGGMLSASEDTKGTRKEDRIFWQNKMQKII